VSAFVSIPQWPEEEDELTTNSRPDHPTLSSVVWALQTYFACLLYYLAEDETLFAFCILLGAVELFVDWSSSRVGL
jgi:hypothetical protein